MSDNFALTGGTLSGAGLVSVSGLFNWSGGTMSGSGTTRVSSNATASFNGTAAKTLDVRLLENLGTITWSDSGNLQVSNGARIANQSGGVFDARSDATIDLTAGAATVTNAGTWKKSVATGVSNIEAAFTNSGTLEVQTGTVYLSGGFSNFSGTTLTGGTYIVTGTLKFTGANIVTDNATVTLDGTNSRILNQTDSDALGNLSGIATSGSFTVRNGRNFTAQGALNNAGTLSAGNASSIGLNGGGTHTGNFNPLSGGNIVFAGGTHTVQTGVTFTGSGTTSLVTWGVLNVTGNVSASPGSIFEITGTNAVLTGSGTFTDNGTFNWTAGRIAGLTVVIASGAVMNISGGEDYSLRSGYTLTNNGTIRWSPGNINSESGGGTINNNGTFEIQNDARLHHWDGTTVFNNAGTFRKSGGTGTTTVSREGGGGTGVFNFNNTGRVEVQSGTLNFWNNSGTSSGTYDVSAGKALTFTAGTHTVQTGVTFTGSGTTRVTGGVLNVTGNVSASSSSIFEVAATSNGNLSGSGTFTSNGTFNWTGGTRASRETLFWIAKEAKEKG